MGKHNRFTAASFDFPRLSTFALFDLPLRYFPVLKMHYRAGICLVILAACCGTAVSVKCASWEPLSPTNPECGPEEKCCQINNLSWRCIPKDAVCCTWELSRDHGTFCNKTDSCCYGVYGPACYNNQTEICCYNEPHPWDWVCDAKTQTCGGPKVGCVDK